MGKQLLSTVSLMALVVGCAPAVLPPAEVPTQVLVTADASGAPAAGEGQVAIDTATGEPSMVEEITGHVETVTPHGNLLDGQSFRKVCDETPCVANLPLGSHDLRLTSLRDPTHGGTGSVTVTQQPTDYRYELGHQLDSSNAGLLPIGLGVSGMLLGAVTLAGGLTDPSASSIATPIGVGALVVGAAVTAIGAYLLTSERGEAQNGAGIQWTPAS